MIFGDLVDLKLPDSRLTGEEKPRKNLTQETCPDRGSNPGPLCDKRACYHLFHSGGLLQLTFLLQIYFEVFSLVEKKHHLSSEAVVAGSAIQVKFKEILGEAAHLCPSPAYATAPRMCLLKFLV